MTESSQIKKNFLISCRLARNDDIDEICRLDERSFIRSFIQRSIASSYCHVAVINENLIVGYAVLDYSFYAQAFISMLFVHSLYRRQRIGLTLMKYLEQLVQTSSNKLFTSTNLSNLPMQSLLTLLNYKLTGIIHNLDDGDPELVYFKLLST